MINDKIRNTDKCLIVPRLQTRYENPFVLRLEVTAAETNVNDYTAHVVSTPFSDNDIVAAIPCLDGTRILNSFGVGFGRGEVVLEIFCGTNPTGGAQSKGAKIAQEVFDKVRISSGEQGTQGVAVTGKGANFLFFPDTLQISGFDPKRGVVMAQMGGFAYTQSGSGGST